MAGRSGGDPERHFDHDAAHASPPGEVARAIALSVVRPRPSFQAASNAAGSSRSRIAATAASNVLRSFMTMGAAPTSRIRSAAPSSRAARAGSGRDLSRRSPCDAFRSELADPGEDRRRDRSEECSKPAVAQAHCPEHDVQGPQPQPPPDADDGREGPGPGQSSQGFAPACRGGRRQRCDYGKPAATLGSAGLDLVNHGRGEGLTPDEMREIVSAFGVQTTLV